MSEKDPNNLLFLSTALAFVLSMGGALIAYFRSLHEKKVVFSWFDLLIRLITGLFIGLLAAAFVKSLGYGELAVGAVAGVAGMFSEQIVKLLEVWVFKVAKDKFGVELDPKKAAHITPEKENKK